MDNINQYYVKFFFYMFSTGLQISVFVENILYAHYKIFYMCFVHILHWLKGYKYCVKDVLDVFGTSLQISYIMSKIFYMCLVLHQ